MSPVRKITEIDSDIAYQMCSPLVSSPWTPSKEVSDRTRSRTVSMDLTSLNPVEGTHAGTMAPATLASLIPVDADIIDCDGPASPVGSMGSGSSTVEDLEDNRDFNPGLDFIDLTVENVEEGLRELTVETAPSAWEVLDRFEIGNRIYRAGKCVELRSGGRFLRITKVLRKDGKVHLKGDMFIRLRDARGLFPRRVNELCWLIVLTKEQAEQNIAVNQFEIPIEEVVKFRILHLTNQPYAWRNIITETGHAHKFTSEEDITETGRLYCRLKLVQIHSNGRIDEKFAIHLREHEADVAFRSSQEDLRDEWRGRGRGRTLFGGSSVRKHVNGTPKRKRSSVIDLTGGDSTVRNQVGEYEEEQSQIVRKYTFMDGFCGAGGVSRGAMIAGLAVVAAFDKCPDAVHTYSRNFTNADIKEASVDQWLSEYDSASAPFVDVLHLSPPCQTFSPAHTIAAITDEANEACLFSCRELVSRIKPRIVTIEETAGLVQRHEIFMNSIIHNFVELGYSVRWRLVNCMAYGIPQDRRRLVMIAAG